MLMFKSIKLSQPSLFNKKISFFINIAHFSMVLKSYPCMFHSDNRCLFKSFKIYSIDDVDSEMYKLLADFDRKYSSLISITFLYKRFISLLMSSHNHFFLRFGTLDMCIELNLYNSTKLFSNSRFDMPLLLFNTANISLLYYNRPVVHRPYYINSVLLPVRKEPSKLQTDNRQVFLIHIVQTE